MAPSSTGKNFFFTHCSIYFRGRCWLIISRPMCHFYKCINKTMRHQHQVSIFFLINFSPLCLMIVQSLNRIIYPMFFLVFCGSLGFQIQKYILIGLEQFFVDIFVWELEMETWFSEFLDVKLGSGYYLFAPLPFPLYSHYGLCYEPEKSERI